MPQAIAGAVITGLGVAKGGIAALLITSAAYVGVSLVASWAMAALAPKPPDFSGLAGDQGPRGTLVNQKSAISPHDFVYGETRKGGIITYYETTGADNKYLHQIITLAGHEVDSIGDIYLNDEVVTLDGNGVVTSGSYAGKVRVRKNLGAADQATDPVLLAESNIINANFRGRGIAYLYVRYEYDQDVFANGLPLVTAVVRGKKVFDPRTSTTAWSNNAALCVRDYITSSYGLNDDQIDDTVFSAAANVCDENVTLSGGGTEKRYTINGTATANTPHGNVLQDMMTACAGNLFWGAGKWKLVVADYIAPTKNLDLDDLRGPISVSTRVNLQDQFNKVQGTFNNAANRWIIADYPPITSATFVAEDGGEETTLDFQLPFTTSAATAQRLAKLTLFRGREQITVTADFGLDAFDVEVGEIITFSNPRYGWTNKEFEVVGWRFGAGEAGDLRVTLTLRETSEAAFDWDAEESAIINNNSTLPKATDAPNVSLAIDTELRVSNEQVVGVLLMDVSSTSPFADRFEVQFRRSGTTEWVAAGQSTTNRFEAVGVSDGFFDVRARAITGLGVRGPFNTITDFYATLFEAPPATVQNFTGNVVGSTLHLSWDAVPDLDLSHYKIRYSRDTLGAVYQDAVDLVPKIARPGVTATVPARSGTYFIKAVDKLGIASVAPASFVVVTNITQVENLNVVETLTESPAFVGTFDKTARTSDGDQVYLTLDTDNLFDSVSGDFDDATGLFDSGGPDGSLATQGTYQFSEVVDLGQVYTSRVQVDLDTRFLDYANTFDSATGLFDNYPGDFDGDPSQFDLTSVAVQVSFTNDDPTGTPTWSDWQNITVSDITARAIRFRVVLSTQSQTAAPAVTSLSATVDMPDRLEAESDLTYTGSRVVTFPVPFKVTPSIGIAATLADGDRYSITSKSRTGFTITTLTGASVSTQPTTFDYVAKGYGREVI